MPRRDGTGVGPLDKSSIIIYHSQKPLQFLDCGWWLNLANRIHFARKRLDAVLVAEMPKKFDGSLTQDAFLAVHYQTVFLQDAEDPLEILEVFLW